MPEQQRRFSLFLTIVLGIWTALHVYVFWRIASIPWVASHLSSTALAGIAFLLWSGYPLARIFSAKGWDKYLRPYEFVAALWIGILFLIFSMMVVADVVTLGGWLFPETVRDIRGWALLTALGLSIVAIIQGARPPVVSEHEVSLRQLPWSLDGLVLVAVSDLHLGTLFGRRWLQKQINRIEKLKPRLVAIVGDLVDGEVRHVELLVPVLKTLQAPLGVWAVTGNHEYYAGSDESVSVLQQAGFHVLRNRAVEVVPGLVVAGVDDLTARVHFGIQSNYLERALNNRPKGATIFLSHTPWEAESAAAAGAGLMLSGHTHNGQLWPFSLLVRLRYKLLGGRYQIGAMTAIVCRGTGGWGPRMRLWKPPEILRITLRSAEKVSPSAETSQAPAAG